MGADMVTVASAGAGRRSVRIESKTLYHDGLFVITLDHVPTGCGTWPAFWMFGEDAGHTWPAWGEYDIIEGAHTTTHAITTLHTTAGCDQSSLVPGSDFSSKWQPGMDLGKPADNCDVGAPGQWHNQGCSQRGPDGSMGADFNAQGGGTFAAEWAPSHDVEVGADSEAVTPGYIRTWFWPAGSEPDDVRTRSPDTQTWGTPYSYFRLAESSCSAKHFQNMRLVFDLTLCGELGDTTFAAICPDIAASMNCREFVERHPERMQEAYWSIRALDVYRRWRGEETQTRSLRGHGHSHGGDSDIVA